MRTGVPFPWREPKLAETTLNGQKLYSMQHTRYTKGNLLYIILLFPYS